MTTSTRSLRLINSWSFADLGFTAITGAACLFVPLNGTSFLSLKSIEAGSGAIFKGRAATSAARLLQHVGIEHAQRLSVEEGRDILGATAVEHAPVLVRDIAEVGRKHRARQA